MKPQTRVLIQSFILLVVYVTYSCNNAGKPGCDGSSPGGRVRGVLSYKGREDKPESMKTTGTAESMQTIQLGSVDRFRPCHGTHQYTIVPHELGLFMCK